MIPQDQPARSQMIEYMIAGCETKDNLTEWESDFVSSISTQYKNRKDLSNRQCEILEKIYDKD